jgi:hypothetical protein
MSYVIKKYEGFLSRWRKPKEIVKSKEEIEIQNDVKNLLSFFHDNGVHSISDYNDLNDLEKSFIKSILRSKNKDHQIEVEFRIELELANRHQLYRMLKMYEEEEDYEKCVIIKRKLDEKV